MADEQIIADIKVDSEEVLKAEKALDRLTDSIEELGNEIINTRKQNKEFKKQQQELNKLYKEGAISSEDYEKEIDGLNKKIKINNKTIAESSVELSKQKRERTANIKLLNSERQSLAQLEAQASLLNQQITKQTKSTKEGREEFDRLEKELGEVNKAVNEQRQAFNDNTKNIGNYKESLQGVNPASSSAVGAIDKVRGAFSLLAKNPIIVILGIIIGALSALFKAFKKSESGSRLLGKAMAGLRGFMAVLTKVADGLAKGLVRLFESPQQAIKDLIQTLKDKLFKRFEGLILIVKSFAGIIRSLAKGDMKALEESAKDAADGISLLTTGKTVEEIQELKDSALDLAKAFTDFNNAQFALRGTVRNLEKSIATLNAEFETLGEIAGDDTRSMIEMREAAIKASEKAVELSKRQEALASARLNVINLELVARRKAGEDIQNLLDQQAQAEVQLTEARSQSAIRQQKILIEQRKVERDIFEQNLDILIDVGDKIKTEQEKAIQNEDLTLEKRKELLEGARVALSANFAEIKKEYELYGITAEQINEVINASDAKQTNEKLKALGLNEIANNRLREIILERRQAELDFADIDKQLTEEEVQRSIEASEAIAEQAQIVFEEEQERLEERKELLDDFFSDIISSTSEFAGEELALFGKIAAGIAKAFQDGKVSAENAIAGINIASNAVFDAISARRKDDLTENETTRKSELELVKGNKEAEDEINLFFDRKSAALKLKQFNADKAKAIVDIAIATSLAVIKAASALPVPPFPFAIAIGALGALQGALVAAKQPPKFGKGTSNIVDIGGSHVSGNDTDVWGFSGNKKQYFGKVQRGEAMPVIRRSAVNDFAIAQLNGRFSPGRTFQQGTPDITNQDQNNEVFVNNLVEAFQNVQIVAKIEDITKEARKKIEIVDNSKV